jgi:hypothetical protein
MQIGSASPNPVRHFRLGLVGQILRSRFQPSLTPTLRGSMTSRSRTVTILAVLAFVAFLLYSTLSSQRYECTVTVEFKGGRQTGTASAATESAAAEQAQTAACGPLARGMDESIGCGRRPPVSRTCRTL